MDKVNPIIKLGLKDGLVSVLKKIYRHFINYSSRINLKIKLLRLMVLFLKEKIFYWPIVIILSM